MNITINNLSFNKIWNVKNPAFKGGFNTSNINMQEQTEDEFFFYAHELEKNEKKDFLSYITSPEINYGSEIKPPILSRIVDNYDTDTLLSILNKFNSNPENKKAAINYVLADINENLAWAYIYNPKGLNKVLKLALNESLNKSEALYNTIDKLGNTLLTNSVYQKDSIITKNIIRTIDDKTLFDLLMTKNIYGEYPIGKLEKGKCIHKISRMLPHNDEVKKTQIPSSTVEILRKGALQLIKNSNLTDSEKMRLCYIYAPRNNEKKDSTYTDFKNIISDINRAFELMQ